MTGSAGIWRAAWRRWCLDVQDAALTFARAVDRADKWVLRVLVGPGRAEALLAHRRDDPGFYRDDYWNKVSWRSGSAAGCDRGRSRAIS